MPLPLFLENSGGLEVKGRQKLETQFEELIAGLQKRFEDHGDEHFIISDLDVSQNKLSLDQFQTLFTTLSYPNVCVERFRMFGCPTFNDGVMQVFSDYFRRFAPDCAPLELHLSDCAVTSEGFHSLCSALEETQLFPKASSSSPTMGTPLYLRLENNYIAEDDIKKKVDAGIFCHFSKAGRFAPLSGGPKVNLVVKGSSYGQKSGAPPAPEQAPPPKQIYDRNNPMPQQEAWNPMMVMMQLWGGKKGGKAGKGGMQKGGMLPWPGLLALAAGKGKQGKGKGKQSTESSQSGNDHPWEQQNHNYNQQGQQGQSSQSSWQSSWQNPREWQSNEQNQSWKTEAREEKSSWQSQGGWQNEWKDKEKPTEQWSSWKSDKSGDNFWESKASQGQSDQKHPWQQSQEWKRQEGGRGWNAGNGSEDRSRTPAPRSKPEVDEKPPHPWEVHYCDEHRLKYFWNSETGESLWEKPEKW